MQKKDEKVSQNQEMVGNYFVSTDLKTKEQLKDLYERTTFLKPVARFT